MSIKLTTTSPTSLLTAIITRREVNRQLSECARTSIGGGGFNEAVASRRIAVYSLQIMLRKRVRKTPPPKLFIAFGDVLRSERRKIGLSQERLALKAGIDRTFVSQMERGICQPTITMIFKLAAVLQIAPHELVARAMTLYRA